MARRKKNDTDLTDEREELEFSELEEEAAEAAEIEALAETEKDEADEDEAEKPKAKPRARKRAPRKRKEPTVVSQLFEAASRVETDEEEVSVTEPVLETETAVEAESSEKTEPRIAVDAVARQWTALRDVSQGAAQNFEKVAVMMRDLQARQPAPVRPSFLARVSLGLSAVAILLSMLSLTLAQNTRSQLLSTELAQALAPSHGPRAAAVSPRQPRAESGSSVKIELAKRVSSPKRKR